MSFVYPLFLFALAALSIPLIIHLFNFRRYKKIEFTNVAMLNEIEVTTRSVKQLKNLLILLARLLALAFLVLAFAQPFIPTADENQILKNGRTVIYIDNSFSLRQTKDGKDLLQIAKETAHKIIETSSAEIGFFLVTNNFRQSEFNDLNKDEMLKEIDKVEFSIKSKSFNDILNRFNALNQNINEDGLNAFIVSDFQKSQFQGEKFEADSNIYLNLVRIESGSSSNLSIDSCWFSNPGISMREADSLSFKVSNFSDNTLTNYPFRLYINERQISLVNLSLEPWSSSETSIEIPAQGFGSFKGSITTQDAEMEFDNSLFFNVNNDSSKQVYLIGSKSSMKYMEALYSDPINFKYDSEKNIDVAYLNSSSCIIIQQPVELSSGLIAAIKQQVESGSNLLIVPNDTNDLNQLNGLLSALNLETFASKDTTDKSIVSLNTKSALLDGVIDKMPENPDLPKTYSRYKINDKVQIRKEDVMEFDNHQSALRKYPLGLGAIYSLCFGLKRSESNFVKHSLFVPLMLNFAYSSGASHPLYFNLDHVIQLQIPEKNKTEEIFHLIGNGVDIIPEIKRLDGKSYLSVNDQFNNAGYVDVFADNEISSSIAVNYSRAESNLKTLNEDELFQIVGDNSSIKGSLISGKNEDVTNALGKFGQPIMLWKYCLILALLFGISEVLIIKLIKS